MSPTIWNRAYDQTADNRWKSTMERLHEHKIKFKSCIEYGVVVLEAYSHNDKQERFLKHLNFAAGKWPLKD